MLFPNGTVKTSLPDGSQFVRFANGDVKQTYPDGRVEYYFSDVATWQVTYASGTEVFHFPTGQVRLCLITRLAGRG